MEMQELSNDLDAEDVCLTCVQLLDSIALNSQTELSYSDMEIAIKSAIYFDECSKLLGDRLPTALHEYNPIYARIFAHHKLFDGNAAALVLTKILQTKNGMNALYNIENILKSIKNSTEVTYLLQIVFENARSGGEVLCKNRQALLALVKRIFKLPTEHIDTAVERLLEQMHFNRLGFIYLEPESSLYMDKFAVLERKIGARFTAGKVPSYVLRSMLDTIQTSTQGVQFFWTCLSNKTFSESLIEFFQQYVQRTDSRDSECECVVRLIVAALRNESPCQKKLYTALFSRNLSKYWMGLLTNAVFVFD